MAAKKKTRKRSAPTIPLATVIGATAGLIEPIRRGLAGDTQGALIEVTKNYTGYDTNFKEWKFSNLVNGLAPLVAGVVVSTIASMFGVNRRLARAKIPLLRI